MDLKTPLTSLRHPGNAGPRDIDRKSLRPQGGRSYVRGETDRAPSRRTVFELLQRTELHQSGADAAVFVEHGVRLSWSALRHEADSVAAGLLALGLRRGDRLGIWSPNSPEWLITQFATARIGVILVTINPAYRVHELEHALKQSGCTALVLAAQFKSSDYRAMIRELAPDLGATSPGLCVSARLPDLQHVICTSPSQDMLGFDALSTLGGPAHRARLDTLSAELDPDDPINIQFTSGTTGAPKGATLTHENIVNNARYVVERMALSTRDRLCIPVPLYHCFGMVMGTLGCTAVGATMVFPGESFAPDTTLVALSKERCTALYGVPTMFIAMLEHPSFDDHDLAELRTGIMAGAPCPSEVMRRVMAQMHMHEVTIAYGMTETSPVSFQSHIDDPVDKRVTSVGRIHPNVEVKIIDSQGRTVAVGNEGELCTRGYCVMQGYWDEPELTSEAIDRAGWMHTGDLARVDEHGYCYIVGRVKDMLIRGGENIYPREVEEFLSSHPKIADVQVFGVPDERYGEAVCAWVVLRQGEHATEDDIRTFCQAKIAHFKVPKHIKFVDSLPMTVTGKPQKFIMRDAMIEQLSQPSQDSSR
jgi:fatty-acyl-CoA synthase